LNFQPSAGPAPGDDAPAGDLRNPELEPAEGEAKYFVADSFSFGVEREMKESGEKGGTEDVDFMKESQEQSAVADSFGFGVEREMKESGEKGGTEDINIGVGELQQTTISKSMDTTSGDEAPASSLGIIDDGDAPVKGGNVEFEWKVEPPDSSEPELGLTAGGETDPAADTKYFVADSFSFGVEREMKESGEKGGTEDINIGVGELQENTISKSMDALPGGDGPAEQGLNFQKVTPDPIGEPGLNFVPPVDPESPAGAGPHVRVFDGSTGVDPSDPSSDPAPGAFEGTGETQEMALNFEKISFNNIGMGSAQESDDTEIELKAIEPSPEGGLTGGTIHYTGLEAPAPGGDTGLPAVQNTGPGTPGEDAGIIIINSQPGESSGIIDDGKAEGITDGSSGEQTYGDAGEQVYLKIELENVQDSPPQNLAADPGQASSPPAVDVTEDGKGGEPEDGDVDARDFLIWQKSLGTTPQDADTVEDGKQTALGGPDTGEASADADDDGPAVLFVQKVSEGGAMERLGGADLGGPDTSELDGGVEHEDDWETPVV
jgi:hypothetical protein